jgi:hypothetical protein
MQGSRNKGRMARAIFRIPVRLALNPEDVECRLARDRNGGPRRAHDAPARRRLAHGVPATPR